MADLASLNSPSKRKPDLDSEDELFLEFENKKKVKSQYEDSKDNPQTKDSLDSIRVQPKEDNKENDSKKIAPTITNKLIGSPNISSPKNVASPKTNSKLLIQPKLMFSPLNTKSGNSNVKTESNKVQMPIIVNGEWNIQDFMVDEQWKKLLKDEFEKSYFKEINNFIKEGYKKNIVRPPKELVFNAFNSTKLNQIKVVIIGQDPYHDDGQAHGLAFSVPKGIRLPPSLKNIFIELENDSVDFKRDEKFGGCLQKWTEEGVFLLNTFLTVEAHKAGSHSKIGWDTFTDQVIKLVSEKNSGCAFLLWGNFAQKKESLIDKKRHKIIKCAHPSPFSVQRFFGSKCFSQANSYLKSIGKTPVNWSLV